MDCSTQGFPVHHQLWEFAQTLVYWVSDAIQPSHPLLSPSPPAFNLSHHQGLFQWICSSHQVAKVLEFQLQHQSFQWTPRTDLLAVQGTLKSLLQHHSSKASILWCSVFLIVQLSHNIKPFLKKKKKKACWDFPGSPVVKTLLSMQGTQVQSLVRELDPTCHNKEFACHN